VSVSNVIFMVASVVLMAGIGFVAATAMLFHESDTGQTQDTYGMDTPADKDHWKLLWSGAVLFGLGVMLCCVGGLAYLLEKL